MKISTKEVFQPGTLVPVYFLIFCSKEPLPSPPYEL